MKKWGVGIVVAGLAVLFLVVPLRSIALAAPAEAWFVTQLTTDNHGDVPVLLSDNRVAWTKYDGHDDEIFTWTPATGTTQLTSNTADDFLGGVSDDRVVWVREVSNGEAIYTWTPGGGTVLVTSTDDVYTINSSGDRIVWCEWPKILTWTPSGGIVEVPAIDGADGGLPEVSGDRIAWVAWCQGQFEAFTWTPRGGTVRITTNGRVGESVSVSGDRIAWTCSGQPYQVVTWTPAGGLVEIPSNPLNESYAKVSGDRIVWTADDGTDGDIFAWTPGGGTQQLTKNTYEENRPEVSGDRVSWLQFDGNDNEVYTWSPAGGTVKLTANTREEYWPHISGGRLAWAGYDGANYQVFMAAAYPVTVPEITSLTPASAPTAGGSTVVITGSGFLSMSGAAAVKFGGTNATSYTVNSPTQITAVAPAHTTGKVDVAVTAAGGTSGASGAADDFLYLTRYEQADSHLGYAGTWTVSSTSSASGGSFRYCNGTGSVTVSFTGTYLAWIAKESSVYGIAKVKLDDNDPVSVDLFSSTAVFKRPVWNTGPLDPGPHMVKIEWTATANASATDTNIGVDAFDVLGTLTQAISLTRYQQTASALLYTGTWSSSSISAASGGSFKYADVDGSSVTIPFSGTSLAWIAKKSPAYGKAKVSVDGGSGTDVDLYDAGTLYQRSVWDTGKLTSGLHWVKVEWTGERNDAATDANIGIDAVDVLGALATATRFEQTDSKLVWAGKWTSSSTSSASGSSFKYADSAASVTINFTGISLNILAKKSSVYGIAQIQLDDEDPVLVDFYSSSALYKQTVWKSGFLVPGDHKVTITWTGTKRAAATDYNVNLDALDVIGTLR
jgi:hypothetical protein